MNKIIVRANEEYQVKISNHPKEDEFFYQAYQQARNELEEILSDTYDYYQEKKNRAYIRFETSQKEDDTIDFSNNIIAFSGERGQGKSSAMLSFSNFLKQRNKEKNASFLGNKIASSNFVILDRIDPTKFEDGDEILVIILAKLFHIFSNLWMQSNNKIVEMRGKLLDQFQTCYNEIDAIKSGHTKENYSLGSDLEKLGRIGDSANLKNDFHCLINDFFKYYCAVKQINSEESTNYLVIQLDDTDLKVDRANEIVEDIRKYFMIPNVVILMAVDLNQLTYAIEQSHISQFSKLQTNYGNIRPVPYHEIAVKYIDKLIPGRRKIFLPHLTPATDESVESVTLEYIRVEKSNNVNILSFKNNNGEIIEDIQELLLRFIYQKTGIIFVKPANYLHNIVPRTMRSFVNFLSILNNMNDLKYDNKGNLFLEDNNIKQRLKNIETFENYFKKTWIPNHITISFLGLIDNYNSTPWTIKNKNLLRDLKNQFYSTRDESDSESGMISDAIQTIFDDAKNDNFTFSDVQNVLVKLENIYPNQEIFRLSFAIRTLYTIVLNKIICNNLLHEKDGNNYNIWEVISFLGGDVFGDDADEFIRNDDNGRKRSTFSIHLHRELALNGEFYSRMKSMDFATLIAIFCYFNFPNSSEHPIYRFAYQSDGNNAQASNLLFNVTYPMLHLIQPWTVLQKIPKGYGLKDNLFMNIDIRMLMMTIISNVDLIIKLQNSLKNKDAIKSEKDWLFTEYVIDFYNRVERILNSITYIPFNTDFSIFKKYIKDRKQDLDLIFDLYNANEEFEQDKLLSYDFSEAVSKLTVKRGTKSFEELKTYVEDLLDNLEIWTKIFHIELSYYYEKTLDLDDAISNIYGEMNAHDREVYQKAYNGIVRGLKKEFIL